MHTQTQAYQNKRMDTRHSRLRLELPQLGAALAAEVRLHILDSVAVHVHRHAATIAVDDVQVVVFVRRPIEANHANLHKAVEEGKSGKGKEGW